MPNPIFTITDSFFIKGRGLTLLSCLERDTDPPIRVMIGDEVELSSPDGETFRTRVRGVELIHADPPQPHKAPLGILVSVLPEYSARLCGAKAQVISEEAKR